MRNAKPGIATRKIAVIAFDGADTATVDALRRKAKAEGAVVKILARRAGSIKGTRDKMFAVDETLAGAASVLFDGVFVVGGKKSEMSPSPTDRGVLVRFLHESYRHFKTIASIPEVSRMVRDILAAAPECVGGAPETLPGICLGNSKKPVDDFFRAFAERRHWTRANG